MEWQIFSGHGYIIMAADKRKMDRLIAVAAALITETPLIYPANVPSSRSLLIWVWVKVQILNRFLAFMHFLHSSRHQQRANMYVHVCMQWNFDEFWQLLVRRATLKRGLTNSFLLIADSLTTWSYASIIGMEKKKNCLSFAYLLLNFCLAVCLAIA